MGTYSHAPGRLRVPDQDAYSSPSTHRFHQLQRGVTESNFLHNTYPRSMNCQSPIQGTTACCNLAMHTDTLSLQPKSIVPRTIFTLQAWNVRTCKRNSKSNTTEHLSQLGKTHRCNIVSLDPSSRSKLGPPNRCPWCWDCNTQCHMLYTVSCYTQCHNSDIFRLLAGLFSN